MAKACPSARGIAASLLFLLLGACTALLLLQGCVSAPTPARQHYASAIQPGDVKGCYVTYYSNSGQIRLEPFLKVADKEFSSEDGEPEIWGFRVWNLEPPDEHGLTHAVNILASRFLPADNRKYEVPTGTTSRSISCPSSLWSPSQQSSITNR